MGTRLGVPGLLLLTSDGLACATTGACVGSRPLAPDGKTQSVPATPEAADVLEPLHGHPFLATEIAFQGVALSRPAQLLDVAVAEILDAGVRVDPCLSQDLLGTG